MAGGNISLIPRPFSFFFKDYAQKNGKAWESGWEGWRKGGGRRVVGEEKGG